MGAFPDVLADPLVTLPGRVCQPIVGRPDQVFLDIFGDWPKVTESINSNGAMTHLWMISPVFGLCPLYFSLVRE